MIASANIRYEIKKQIYILFEAELPPKASRAMIEKIKQFSGILQTVRCTYGFWKVKKVYVRCLIPEVNAVEFGLIN